LVIEIRYKQMPNPAIAIKLRDAFKKIKEIQGFKELQIHTSFDESMLYDNTGLHLILGITSPYSFCSDLFNLNLPNSSLNTSLENTEIQIDSTTLTFSLVPKVNSKQKRLPKDPISFSITKKPRIKELNLKELKTKAESKEIPIALHLNTVVILTFPFDSNLLEPTLCDRFLKEVIQEMPKMISTDIDDTPLRKMFQDVILKKIHEKQREFDKKIKQFNSSIAHFEKELVQTYQYLEIAQAEKQAFKDFEINKEKAAEALYERLKRIKGVEQIYADKDSLIIKTKFIHLERFYDKIFSKKLIKLKTPIPLGQFLIKINISADAKGGLLHFENLNSTHKEYQHPHITNNSRVCWGTLNQIPISIAKMELEVGITALLTAFLPQCTIGDNYISPESLIKHLQVGVPQKELNKLYEQAIEQCKTK